MTLLWVEQLTYNGIAYNNNGIYTRNNFTTSFSSNASNFINLIKKPDGPDFGAVAFCSHVFARPDKNGPETLEMLEKANSDRAMNKEPNIYVAKGFLEGCRYHKWKTWCKKCVKFWIKTED